jgi:beta-lactamase regulating signal transducer with metallopeptidase domain
MSTAALFSGQFYSALGWALFHFLWQGALVAVVSGALAWLLRERRPALRYALSCGALATMLALPIATAWSLSRRAPAAQAPTAAVAASRELVLSRSGPSEAFVSGEAFLPATVRNRIEALRPWALAAWFAGVLLLALRFLGGLASAQRMTRRGTRPAPPIWQATLGRIAERLSIARSVKLLESTVVQVPTAVGAFRPVILFPATVFLGLPTRGLEALIAHELAHVRRHDYLVNLLQTLAETLLFYHPAVWWVSARIRSEREQCCDDLAIAATGDARTYARALIRLEEMRGAAPALAVAAGGGNLWKRVLRLLTQAPPADDRPSGWVAGIVALAMIVVLGAATRVGPAGNHDAGSGESIEAIDRGVPDVVVQPGTAAVEDNAGDGMEPREGEEPDAEPPIPEEAEMDDASDEPSPPVIRDEATGTGGRTLTAEELDDFRAHGVTPEYVRSIAALGYERAAPEDIVSLKIHGVTAADIAEMNRLFGRQPLEDHVSFKIHGVTAGAVRQLSALGLGTLSPDDVLSMRIHGVDAAYVEKLRAAGYRDLSAEDAVSARIHGVSPADAEGWSRLGYSNVSLEDLVGARIHGASPEFAAELRSLGFDVSLDDVVAFRIHGVTGEFLREMKSLGFTPPSFSADDAVSFRIHGVTPEFVREIRGLGYKDASADDLQELRVHGISAAEIRKENSRAGRRIPLEDLVDRHTRGKDEGTDDEN